MSFFASGQNDARAPHALDEFDDFERGLLPVMRHFILSFTTPTTQAWQHAYSVAIEKWGQDQGLNLAHLVFKVIKATLHCRADGLAFNDPLSVEDRLEITCDERALLKMLHHMRRDETPAARDAVGQVTGGYPDAHLVQAGLTLASRFPTSGECQGQPSRRPVLRVVQ
ncbi:hypothetical protein [Ruegeria sp. EL01]|jgi:hypothetical protein|uniref:hypothetical protein n=1 Tax=Ruegeria sp. EL01 TaxID=2107578 RepID=UPI000EA838E4|nr:hypothetical protein [Ruegeria sp. EL01]